MKLTIKRSGWLRGEGSRNSRLLRGEDGKKCCLGFLGEASGATQEQLTDMCTPAGCQACNRLTNWPAGLVDDTLHNTELCQQLMNTNDDTVLDGKAREEKLTKLFQELGIEVEFVE